MTMVKIWLLEAFTIPLLLASGPEKGMSQGQLFGEVVCVLQHCAPAFAGAAQLQKQEDDPHTKKQVQAPCQVKIKQ